MANLISILQVRGFEFICPMFDGSIARPLREGADVGEIASELTRSYGSTLRTCDTIGIASPEADNQMAESTEAPFPSVCARRPPRVTLGAPSAPAPDDPDSARTPPRARPKIPRASAPDRLHGTTHSDPASVSGAHKVYPDDRPDKKEGCVIDYSGGVTRVSGTETGTYRPRDNTSSATEGRIGSDVYLHDTEESACGTSDTQAFGEAPSPIAPRDIRAADAGRVLGGADRCLWATRENELPTQERAIDANASISDGPTDRRTEDASLYFSHYGPRLFSTTSAFADPPVGW